MTSARSGNGDAAVERSADTGQGAARDTGTVDAGLVDERVEPAERNGASEQTGASEHTELSEQTGASEHTELSEQTGASEHTELSEQTGASERTGSSGPGAGDDAPTKKPSLVARDPGRRQLTDPVVMRALAHPARVALLEALLREGPLTATAAAAILDDSPGNMSWHLNVLAKYGFVEEAEGGRGRSRPWRLVNLGTSFEDEPDNPELSLAGETYSRVIFERNFNRVQKWLNERRTYPQEWINAAFSSQTVTYLTPEELKKFGEEISELLSKYRDRSLDLTKRPEGSRAVALSAYGHPLPPSPSGN